MTIKKLIEKYKARFEAYGGETARGTFDGELNYEAGKLFYLVALPMVIWLPYIQHDLKLHPFPTLTISVRILFSVLCACVIALRFTERFRYRPNILMMAIVTYLSIGTALITGTSAEFAFAYAGGYICIIAIPI